MRAVAVPCFQDAALLLCPHVVEDGGAKGLNTVLRSLSHKGGTLTISSPPKGPPLNATSLEIRFQHQFLGDTKYSSHSFRQEIVAAHSGEVVVKIMIPTPICLCFILPLHHYYYMGI